MTTKEFSNLFGMSVNDMCEFTGFSRDGLNDIVKGASIKPGMKKREALHDLRDLAISLRAQEMKESEELFNARLKAAEVFQTF